jgi:transcriptional regulator with XRE-family HTH domain
MAKIGENIRRKREELGLSQEELATRMGYKSKSTINKIELGINDIPQNKISKFADVLGTTPAVLMGWVDETTGKKNDVLANIVMQMRKDDELLSMVEKLSKLDPEKRKALMPVLDAFATNEK